MTLREELAKKLETKRPNRIRETAMVLSDKIRTMTDDGYNVMDAICAAFYPVVAEYITRHTQLAVTAEREACAKQLLEASQNLTTFTLNDERRAYGERILVNAAFSIRARSTPEDMDALAVHDRIVARDALLRMAKILDKNMNVHDTNECIAAICREASSYPIAAAQRGAERGRKS